MKNQERISFYNIEKESFISECQLMSKDFNELMATRPKGSPPNFKLRFDLIKEEVEETIEAIEGRCEEKIIDGLCDVLYVTYGAAHTFSMVLDTNRVERQSASNKADWKYLNECINDLRFQLHWIEVDIANQDLKALKKDLTELAIECWEIGYKGLGLDLFPFYAEVHKTNMAKLGGPKREDGKQLKPEGWKPPRIAEMLDELRKSH